MAVDERARHDLYTRLKQVLGEEHAVALMEHLPPTGWGDVARRQDLRALDLALRHDLEALEERINARFAVVDARFDAVENRIEAAVSGVEAKVLSAMVAQTRTFVFATVGALATFAGLVFAAG